MNLLKVIALTMTLGLLGGVANAGIDIGLSADKDGINSFYLAIGEHYTVPEKEIRVVREKNIPDDDLAVVFFLAERARVKPGVIVKLRVGGKSWMDIAFQYGLNAETFYVPLQNPGPPYGKAWGHHKNKKKHEWKKVRFSDAEVAAFVNLRFLSNHYGCSADEIAKMKSDGKSFKSINAAVKQKKQKSAKQLATQDESKAKSKGKGKGKKK